MISGISLKTSDKERKACWRHFMGYSLWLAEMYFNIHHSRYSRVHTATFGTSWKDAYLLMGERDVAQR